MVYKIVSRCYNNHAQPPGPAGRLFDTQIGFDGLYDSPDGIERH